MENNGSWLLCRVVSLTTMRLPIWHDEALVWRDLIEKQPKEPRGWSSYAALLVEENKYTEAEKVIQEGFLIYPMIHSWLKPLAE